MYGIYGNMDPINIPPMLPYIPYMDPMGILMFMPRHFPDVGNQYSIVPWDSKAIVVVFSGDKL